MSNTPKRVKPSEVANITPIRESGKAVVQEAPQEIESNRLLEHLYSGADIDKIPPTTWQVEGLLIEGGLSALYSEPGLGKSFVAIDMGVCAVLHEPWCGKYFKENTKVLYIAAERYKECADRLRAAVKKRGLSMKHLENFTLLAAPRPPQVTQGDNRELHTDFLDLMEVTAKIKPDLIIFDTFARMTINEDENATKNMGVIVENFRQVMSAAGELCGGHVVHHAGKDKSKGMRGNTALLGAVDVVFRLEKHGEGLKLSVEKINAGETPPPAYFQIESIAMSDPQKPGETRPIGVLVSKDYAQVAKGIKGDLLDLVCELYIEGVSTIEITNTYNAEHAPLGKDAAKTAKHTIRRALNELRDDENGALMRLEGKGRSAMYYPTAKAIAAYKEKNPTS